MDDYERIDWWERGEPYSQAKEAGIRGDYIQLTANLIKD